MAVETIEVQTLRVVCATIRLFDPEKGYGFARLEDSDRDVFIHITKFGRVMIHGLTQRFGMLQLNEAEVKLHLSKGQGIVLFGMGEGEKGLFATMWTTDAYIEKESFYFVFQRDETTKKDVKEGQDKKRRLWTRTVTVTVISKMRPVFVGGLQEASKLVASNASRYVLYSFDGCGEFEEMSL